MLSNRHRFVYISATGKRPDVAWLRLSDLCVVDSPLARGGLERDLATVPKDGEVSALEQASYDPQQNLLLVRAEGLAVVAREDLALDVATLGEFVTLGKPEKSQPIGVASHDHWNEVDLVLLHTVVTEARLDYLVVTFRSLADRGLVPYLAIPCCGVGIGRPIGRPGAACAEAGERQDGGKGANDAQVVGEFLHGSVLSVKPLA